MTRATREQAKQLMFKRGVKFCPHNKSVKMCLVSLYHRFFGISNWQEHFWLTLGRTIYHPPNVTEPMAHIEQVAHELVHVEQQAKTFLWWWVIRYLTSWKYRWKMEREAYLVEIRDYGRTITSVCSILRRDYMIPIPPHRMCSWFVDKTEESRTRVTIDGEEFEGLV